MVNPDDLPFEEFEAARAHRKCQRRVSSLIKDGNIQFLLLSLFKNGCSKKISFICEPCEKGGVAAYFAMTDGKPRVVICENNSLRGIKANITHELVHAYDYCRADLDDISCKELACTEIRASMLSGECTLSKELQRGKVGFMGHMRDCVRRRALMSVQMHPHCPGVAGEKALNDVFEACFNDREPFGCFPKADKSVF